MSKDIGVIKFTGGQSRELTLTQFYGGAARGKMLQLTQGLGSVIGGDEPSFIQLTAQDVRSLRKELQKWLKSLEDSI